LVLPFVTGGVGTGIRRFGKYTTDGVGNYDVQFSPNITRDQVVPQNLPNYDIGFQTTWEADIWGKLNNTKKSALAQYLSSIEGKNYVITNLVAEVANDYYNLLALDNELATIQQTITLQQNSLEIIKTQKSAGAANELAVKQFEAQVLNFKSLEFDIKQAITEEENKMNFLLGRFPQDVPRSNTLFSQDAPTTIHKGIPTDLLKNRPDVRQAEYVLQAMNFDVLAAKAAFYPSLNIGLNIGLQSFNEKFILSPESFAYNLFGGLTAPLINRSAIKSRFNAAKAREVEALYNYQKSILNGYIEVYNQISKISNLERMYSLKSQEVQTLDQSIAISQSLFSTGRASYLEVIYTQKNSLQTKLELAIIKKKQYNAIVDVYKALGGGWQ
jgi:outer membrane protein, multidrug efflux system